MDHDIGNRQLTQIKQPAQDVLVRFFHVAGAMQKIDGAAQLLVRGDDSLVDADLHAEQTQN